MEATLAVGLEVGERPGDGVVRRSARELPQPSEACRSSMLFRPPFSLLNLREGEPSSRAGLGRTFSLAATLLRAGRE